MIPRPGPFLATALLLAGCSTAQRPAERDSVERYLATGSIVARAQDGRIARLGGPERAIARVETIPMPDARLQEIRFAPDEPGGDARSILIVGVGTGERAFADQRLPRKPDETGIAVEIRQRFPDVPMNLVQSPRRTIHGPLGLAVGRRADGLNCAYGWQWLDRGPVIDGRSGDMVSARVALCSRRLTLDGLVADIEGLVIGGSSGTAPATIARPPTTTPVARQPTRERAEPPRARDEVSPVLVPAGGRPRYLGDGAPALAAVAPTDFVVMPPVVAGGGHRGR